MLKRAVPSLVAALTAIMVVAATPVPGVTPSSAAATGVRIANQSARWASLSAGDPLNARTDTLFVISGEVENGGSAAVQWVKLAYELIADGGDGETVVAREYGYNLRAEALRDPAVEGGAIPTSALDVRPLASGERDLFRMVFFRADVGRFDRWRVRILEVR